MFGRWDGRLAPAPARLAPRDDLLVPILARIRLRTSLPGAARAVKGGGHGDSGAAHIGRS